MTSRVRRQHHGSALAGRTESARPCAEQENPTLILAGAPMPVSLMIDPIGVI
ncbi:MAG: hypothetical protein MI919_29985 [Holophagales bacterium]|nr:hypothetical protein [Holophagales bacterium]